LAASAYATIQCAIELRGADLRKDLTNIEVPTLILHGVNDRVCLFDLAKVMHESINGSQLYKLKKLVMVSTLKNASELTQNLSGLLASSLFFYD